MKKIILTGILMFLLSILVACAPSIDTAKANYCQDLGDFGKAVVNLRQIDDTSTVDELKAAEKEVAKTWDDLAKSVGNLNDSQFKELEQAFKELDKTVNSVPDDATLAEVQAGIRLATLETMAQYADIAATTCVYGQEQ